MLQPLRRLYSTNVNESSPLSELNAFLKKSLFSFSTCQPFPRERVRRIHRVEHLPRARDVNAMMISLNTASFVCGVSVGTRVRGAGSIFGFVVKCQDNGVGSDLP